MKKHRVIAYIDGSDRQRIYLEAFRTNSEVEVQLGYFSVHKTKMPPADSWDKGKIVMAEVVKTEEKGTDVNLAVQPAVDAVQDKFDYAMLFSNQNQNRSDNQKTERLVKFSTPL